MKATQIYPQQSCPQYQGCTRLCTQRDLKLIVLSSKQSLSHGIPLLVLALDFIGEVQLEGCCCESRMV